MPTLAPVENLGEPVPDAPWDPELVALVGDLFPDEALNASDVCTASPLCASTFSASSVDLIASTLSASSAALFAPPLSDPSADPLVPIASASFAAPFAPALADSFTAPFAPALADSFMAPFAPALADSFTAPFAPALADSFASPLASTVFAASAVASAPLVSAPPSSSSLFPLPVALPIGSQPTPAISPPVGDTRLAQPIQGAPPLCAAVSAPATAKASGPAPPSGASTADLRSRSPMSPRRARNLASNRRAQAKYRDRLRRERERVEVATRTTALALAAARHEHAALSARTVALERAVAFREDCIAILQAAEEVIGSWRSINRSQDARTLRDLFGTAPPLRGGPSTPSPETSPCSVSGVGAVLQRSMDANLFSSSPSILETPSSAPQPTPLAPASSKRSAQGQGDFPCNFLAAAYGVTFPAVEGLTIAQRSRFDIYWLMIRLGDVPKALASDSNLEQMDVQDVSLYLRRILLDMTHSLVEHTPCVAETKQAMSEAGPNATPGLDEAPIESTMGVFQDESVTGAAFAESIAGAAPASSGSDARSSRSPGSRASWEESRSKITPQEFAFLERRLFSPDQCSRTGDTMSKGHTRQAPCRGAPGQSCRSQCPLFRATSKQSGFKATSQAETQEEIVHFPGLGSPSSSPSTFERSQGSRDVLRAIIYSSEIDPSRRAEVDRHMLERSSYWDTKPPCVRTTHAEMVRAIRTILERRPADLATILQGSPAQVAATERDPAHWESVHEALRMTPHQAREALRMAREADGALRRISERRAKALKQVLEILRDPDDDAWVREAAACGDSRSDASQGSAEDGCPMRSSAAHAASSVPGAARASRLTAAIVAVAKLRKTLADERAVWMYINVSMFHIMEPWQSVIVSTLAWPCVWDVGRHLDVIARLEAARERSAAMPERDSVDPPTGLQTPAPRSMRELFSASSSSSTPRSSRCISDSDATRLATTASSSARSVCGDETPSRPWGHAFIAGFERKIKSDGVEAAF